MKSLFQFLSIGRNLFVLFCLFLLFNFLLSYFLPKEYVLDLMFAYSAEEAYVALNHLDLNQIKIYRFGIWFFDMPYMLIYCLLFSGILLKLFRRRSMVSLPVTILVLDLFENLLVFRMLTIYPVQNEILATWASFFSTSKWVFVGILILVLFFGLLSLLNFKKYLTANSAEARI